MAIAKQVKELLLQSLEHERGGVILYRTALECVQEEGLRAEWEKYLKQTQMHVEVLTTTSYALGLDPGEMTPARKLVQQLGKSLVMAMKAALAANDPIAAELLACDCVVSAETKDHFNWELIGKCAEALPAEQGQVLKEAFDLVEDEEDEHLYHSKGWGRELWFKALGLPAVLPPEEEARDVKSARDAAKIDAARAKG